MSNSFDILFYLLDYAYISSSSGTTDPNTLTNCYWLSGMASQQESVEEDAEELTAWAEDETPAVVVLGSRIEEQVNSSSAVKLFGLSASGIFVLFTIIATKKKKQAKED